MDGRCIATPLGKSNNFQDTNTRIKRHGEDVTDFDAMTGRFLTRSINPDVSLGDQSCGIGTGSDHPRVPQPSIDPLTFQARN
jgi:hypothetical protein